MLDIAKSPVAAETCTECASLSCSGWVSKPGYFDLRKLNILGTLRVEGAEECWDEYHPNSTNMWSADAPIAVEYYPYSRSDVFECRGCKRKFLHYTEFGGYYVDERIRELNLALIV